MASTVIGTSHEIAQTIYRAGLIQQAEVNTLAASFWGTEDDAVCQLQEDFTRERGDTMKIRFSPTVDQTGFGDQDEIEGNESSLTWDTDTLTINYHAFAYALSGVMSQQRTNINLKKTSLTKLAIQWTRHWERNFFNQACAYTPVNSTANYSLSGMNIVTAIDADHIVRANSLGTDDLVGADTSATMSLDYIDELVTRASSTAYLDYPIPPSSSGYYYLVLHTENAKQLRQNTSAGDWQDIQRALLEGGLDYKSSPIAKGFLGLYNNTIIVSSDYIPKGVQAADSTAAVSNTRRAVFFGARAMVAGFGNGYTDGNHLDWVEQTRDYRKWGVMADSVYGMKRILFDDLSGSKQTYGLQILTLYSAV